MRPRYASPCVLHNAILLLFVIFRQKKKKKKQVSASLHYINSVEGDGDRANGPVPIPRGSVAALSLGELG